MSPFDFWPARSSSCTSAHWLSCSSKCHREMAVRLSLSLVSICLSSSPSRSTFINISSIYSFYLCLCTPFTVLVISLPSCHESLIQHTHTTSSSLEEVSNKSWCGQSYADVLHRSSRSSSSSSTLRKHTLRNLHRRRAPQISLDPKARRSCNHQEQKDRTSQAS